MRMPFAIQPLPFDPAFEQIPADEGHTTEQLCNAMHSIQQRTSHDYGHAIRSVHAKSHGLLEGELTVLDDLPAALAQGLFARPGTHQTVLRLSTNSGDLLDDSVSTPRGLAIKIAGVEGARLPGSEATRRRTS